MQQVFRTHSIAQAAFEQPFSVARIDLVHPIPHAFLGHGEHVPAKDGDVFVNGRICHKGVLRGKVDPEIFHAFVELQVGKALLVFAPFVRCFSIVERAWNSL